MKYGSSNDTAIVDVILKRRLTGIIMTTYMPTILLNIIGHSTNYFKPLYFDAKITVNLTVSKCKSMNLNLELHNTFKKPFQQEFW